jgi:hypothetical protein
LVVPDRFEGLRAEAGAGQLRSIVAPVTSALKSIDERFIEMRSARRGALMILRGESGAGKSTFLDTVGLFRDGVATERISGSTEISDGLSSLPSPGQPRVVVLEGREALGEESTNTLEAGLHAINAFVRSDQGQDTLLVWPTNTDDLTKRLVSIAETLGAEALFGVRDPVERFSGPPQGEFVSIAERTVAALNEGASLAALGISESQAADMAGEAETIGRYLAEIRRQLVENNARVRGLLATEQYRLWTVVIAGNDPEGDVAALTRGGHAYADIDRLLTATAANIVEELRKYPEQLGILGTVLDAKILHLDRVTTLAVAREFGDTRLHSLMREAGMSTTADPKAGERLASSELGLILAGGSLGTRKRGSKAGGGTDAAFKSLAQIARTNDAAINRAVGTGLKSLGLIDDFELEKDLGTSLKFSSDLYCLKSQEPIRIEVMWRSTTSRAEIANYALTKLGNYGRAIGLLTGE